MSGEMDRVGEIAKQIGEYAKWASRSAAQHRAASVGSPVVERVQHVASASLLESAAVRASAWAEGLAELVGVASVQET